MKNLVIPLINAWGKRIESKRFVNPPVYIGGCGRSGTTLLLSILSAHPEIFGCPRELNLFENGRLEKEKLVLPKYYRLYRTFIRESIPASANRFCEKSPSNIRNIDLIDRLHNGRFRFIHIIRDGRDVILSKHPRNKDAYWVGPQRWIKDVSLGLDYSDHPAVMEVRYESLVNSYEETITGICQFLSVPVCEEILQWHKYARVRQNRALHSEIEALTPASIEKWKLPENQERVKALTSIKEGDQLLKKLGYS